MNCRSRAGHHGRRNIDGAHPPRSPQQRRRRRRP